MGRHRLHTPEEPNITGRHRSGTQLGAKALGSLRRGGRHTSDDSGAEQAGSFWHSIAVEVSEFQERVKDTKRTYEHGLTRLVHAGEYDPRILSRLSIVNAMTMVVEGQDDPMLSYALAYADEHGRYISARTLEDKMTLMHEYAHRTLRMGIPGVNIFREPLAERVAQDIGRVEHIEHDEPAAYQTHTRIMDKVLDATGLTFRDMTRIASGPDQIENFEQFRMEAMANTGGRDIVGMTQASYLYHRDNYRQQYPDRNDSAFYAADMTEKELDSYLSSQYQMA